MEVSKNNNNNNEYGGLSKYIENAPLQGCVKREYDVRLRGAK